jgi:hypothetical protein
MSESASGQSALTSEQELDLTHLCLTWAKFYTITCDGATWTAIPLGTDEVITANSTNGLQKILRVDSYSRVTRSGHWVETASGPPYRQ